MPNDPTYEQRLRRAQDNLTSANGAYEDQPSATTSELIADAQRELHAILLEKARWFAIDGHLISQRGRIQVFHSAHAWDLPDGEEGKAEIAERLRKRVADDLDMPTIRWDDDLNVDELPRPSGVIIGDVQL